MNNPLMQSNDNESLIIAIRTEKNQKIIEMVLDFEQSAFQYKTLSELSENYGNLKGYIQCANQLFWLDDNEFSKLNLLVGEKYTKAKLLINMRNK